MIRQCSAQIRQFAGVRRIPRLVLVFAGVFPQVTHFTEKPAIALALRVFPAAISSRDKPPAFCEDAGTPLAFDEVPEAAPLDAAAISLQNTMGMVCDPVGDGCEISCHTRDAVAAANAFICADLILGGYCNPIPLDETIDASYAAGRALCTELRCTARGGIAITPSAQTLAGRIRT